MNQCELCQKAAQVQCGGCYSVRYCSKQHQREDWKKHRQLCRPFEVCEHPTLGRHLVATRFIKPGEVVLQEAPLIWGPSSTTVPVCLGCGKGINEDNSRPCFRCGWPVCNELCEKAPGHLSECRYTVQRGDRVYIKDFGAIHPIYGCITILRCLYRKQFLPRSWKRLDSLRSCCEQRRSTPKYENDRATIVQFIRRFFKLGSTFTEDDIMKIIGIIAVNSHEVPLTDPAHVALYATASLFQHSCSANCAKSFTSEGRLLISAARAIEKGDHLSLCYVDPLGGGTLNRRQALYDSKYLWCECPRCQDPTEFGTYFSALKCNNSCDGLVLPATFLQSEREWICSKCSAVRSSYSVCDILDRIGRDLADVDVTNSESCKQFIATYDEYLSDNHHYMVHVKLCLCQCLGAEAEGLNQMNDNDLFLKAELAQNLISLIKRLAPAEKHTLGILLSQLNATMMEIIKRKAGENSDELRPTLMEFKKMLMEVIDSLQHESETLPEGKLCLQARQKLKDIDTILATGHGIAGDSSN